MNMQWGTLFLLFCKKSPKYQNISVSKFHRTAKFVYVERITTSTANTGNLFKNNLYILMLLKIVLSRIFDMQY